MILLFLSVTLKLNKQTCISFNISIIKAYLHIINMKIKTLKENCLPIQSWT